MANEKVEKKKEEVVDFWKIKKEIVIPRIPNSRNRPDFVCSLGGKHYQIQRGIKVELPLPIYEIAQQSIEAELKAEDFYYSHSS